MLQQRLAGMNSALSGDGDGVNSDGSSDSGLRGRRLSGPAAAYANPGAGMLDALDRVASKSSQPKKEEEIDPTSIPWSVGSIPNAPEGEELLRAESTRDVAEALNEQARATAGSQEAEFLAEMAKQRRDAPPTKPRGEESTQPSASAQDRIKAALEYKRKREGSVSGDSNASEPRAPFLTTVSRVDESRAKEMLQGKGELERMLR